MLLLCLLLRPKQCAYLNKHRPVRAQDLERSCLRHPGFRQHLCQGLRAGLTESTLQSRDAAASDARCRERLLASDVGLHSR